MTFWSANLLKYYPFLNCLVLFKLVETIQETKIISLPHLILDILDNVADY